MQSIDARKLNPKKHQEILDRDIICVYCGDTPTVVDHVVPWSYSRCDDDDNLVASCELCNLIASNKMFENFDAKRKYIKKRRESKSYFSRVNTNAFCNDCGKSFHPGISGSTRFTCSECNEKDYVRKSHSLREIDGEYIIYSS